MTRVKEVKEEQVLIERLIAGMRAIIDVSPAERRHAIAAIRSVDREIADRLEAPPTRRIKA
jgi:hypothetical protein